MPKLPDEGTMLWREFIILRWLGQRFGMNETQKDRYDELEPRFRAYKYNKETNKIDQVYAQS